VNDITIAKYFDSSLTRTCMWLLWSTNTKLYLWCRIQA